MAREITDLKAKLKQSEEKLRQADDKLRQSEVLQLVDQSSKVFEEQRPRSESNTLEAVVKKMEDRMKNLETQKNAEIHVRFLGNFRENSVQFMNCDIHLHKILNFLYKFTVSNICALLQRF